MRRHPCPGTFSLISRSFYCTGIFCGLSRKTRRNFFPPKKEPALPDFHPFCTGSSFCLLYSPQRPVLLIVFVLAVRSAFFGAVLALVLLSIFRIILVGLFLCVIVLGHSALLFSPILFFHENQNAADNICRARKAVHPCCHHCLSCVYRH